MILMAEIYWSMADFKMAMEYVSKTRLKAKNVHFQYELAQSNRVLGLIYVDLGSNKRLRSISFKV